MLDENKGTGQGTPQDAGQSSVGQRESTSDKDTYTREEYQKAISDLKAEQGRQLKQFTGQIAQKDAELTATKSQLQQTNESLGTVESRLDELERQGLEDTPEALKLYQRQKSLQDTERRLKTDRAQFEAEKAQHAEDIRIARETQWDITVWGIASKYQVNPTELKELGITSAEQLEKVASKMVKGTSGQATSPTFEFAPDSGIGTGGREDLNKLDAMSLIKRGVAKK